MPKKSKQKLNRIPDKRDTSRAKRQPAYRKPSNLPVEESIKKDKEVKEKDIFEMPQSNKK